jgi:hypothetical protein
MMPTIRVDQDVFEGLQKLAQPFVDSPSTVIRRMLEERGVLDKGAQGIPTARAQIFSKDKPLVSADGLTPQSVYEKYLLFTLLKEFNSKGHKRDVTHAIVKRMMKDGHIGPADQELVSTGETKAENTIAWARNALKDRGHISRLSPRGIWELTAEGKETAHKVALPKTGQL